MSLSHFGGGVSKMISPQVLIIPMKGGQIICLLKYS